MTVLDINSQSEVLRYFLGREQRELLAFLYDAYVHVIAVELALVDLLQYLDPERDGIVDGRPVLVLLGQHLGGDLLPDPDRVCLVAQQRRARLHFEKPWRGVYPAEQQRYAVRPYAAVERRLEHV